MANKFAHETERTTEAESQLGTQTDSTADERVTVPAMSVVEDTTTVEELDIPFDKQVRQRVLDEVEAEELSDDIKDIVQDDGVLGDRNLFTWKWLWYIFGEPMTLDCVADEYETEAYEAKTLISIYITLVDDIGEQLDDKTTFWELAKTAYPEVEPDWEREDIDSDYAQSLERVWTELMDRLRSSPRFEEFRDEFMFNLRQNVQAMEYAQQSSNSRALMNPEETWHYDTQAIGLYLFWGIDLMYSPSFEMDDYRAFRRLVYNLQPMWRLGNWIITWEREVYEHDYSAGIFVEAINQGIIDEGDLERLEAGEMDPKKVISRIKASGIVEQFIGDWKRRRDELLERDFGMESLDSDDMVGMMEWLMQSHFATEGHR